MRKKTRVYIKDYIDAMQRTEMCERVGKCACKGLNGEKMGWRKESEGKNRGENEFMSE